MQNHIQFVDISAKRVALPIVPRCDGTCMGDSRLD